MGIDRDAYLHLMQRRDEMIQKPGMMIRNAGNRDKTAKVYDPTVLTHTQLVRRIILYLRARGFAAGKIKTQGARIDGKYIRDPYLFRGVADILAFIPQALFIEVKCGRDDLREEQEEFRMFCTRAGISYLVARRVEEVIALVGQ